MLERITHALEHGTLGRPAVTACLSDDPAHSGFLAVASYEEVRRRIAFIDYFATHYRRGLYEELARRMEVDFYFFADERERYWNRKIPLVEAGEFRRVERRRYRVAGEAIMPGLVLELSPRRYDAVVKSLNGKLMLPAVYLASRARDVPFVLWTGMWHHPRTSFHRLTRPATEHVYRSAEAIVTYGEHVKRFLTDTSGVDPSKVYVAGQAVEAERFTAAQPARNGSAEVLYVGQFEERKGLTHLLDAFAALPDLPAKLRLIGNGSLEPQVSRRAAQDPRVELVGYVPQERPACGAGALAVPCAPLDHHGSGSGAMGTGGQRGHARRPAGGGHRCGRSAAGGLVEDGRNGFVVPEGDVSALAVVLGRLAEDPALAERLGDQAREDVGRFTHSAMADAFEAAVEHAVAARR